MTVAPLWPSGSADMGSLFARILSLAGNVVRLAFVLLGPVGLLALAILVRYAVFEYFHGSEQTLRALWQAVRF